MKRVVAICGAFLVISFGTLVTFADDNSKGKNADKKVKETLLNLPRKAVGRPKDRG